MYDLSKKLGLPTTVYLFVVHFLISALCQNGGLPSDPRDQNVVANTFYLTSKSDCSDESKDIFNNRAIVKGYDLNNIGTGPKTCTIRITSSSVYPDVQLQIIIVSMNIQDCRTQLTIYDGEGVQKRGSYDCHTSQNVNRMRMTTSGDTVSFIMSRVNPDNHKFDIEISIKPIRGGLSPDFDKTNPFSFQKFEQEAIVGMIGGLYALVLIICTGIVIYCDIRYRGLNKKWETHQLATMKTDTTLDARSQVSQPPWSVPSQSRGPTSAYARSYVTTEPYSRKGAYARSEDDGSSVVYDHDEKFQQRNLMNDERDRHRGRDRMASQNNTYSDDDDDPDNFKERVITPRVKTSGGAKWKPAARNTRNQRPPSFEEATRASSSERSSDEDEETEESSDEDSTRKRLTTSSEGDDSDYTETETETESEDSNGNSSRRGGGARAAKRRNNKDNKSKSKSNTKSHRRRQSSTDDASSQRTSASRKNGNGRHQNPKHHHQPQQHPLPMPGAMPYGAAAAGYPPPGGQFVPIMAGHPHPQFQQVPMVPPNYPPPQYPVDPTAPNANPQGNNNVKPTDPPVYSYLVRRGYTPLDANNPNNPNNNDRHYSPAGSVNSSQRGPPPFNEEPDTPLQSGVEYMRR